AKLVDKTVDIGIYLVPKTGLIVSPYRSQQLQSPVLYIAIRKAERDIRDLHFYHPAVVLKSNLAFPDSVPGFIAIFTKSSDCAWRKPCISLHVGRSDEELEAVLLVVVGIKKD